MTLSLRCVATAALMCVSPLVADAGWLKNRDQPNSCPAWRPCGSGETWGGNRFIPQGAFGVDARPACQRHDDCYDTPGSNRKDCDRAFLRELQCACEQSNRPRACKRAAYLAYLGVRLFGGSSKGESLR